MGDTFMISGRTSKRAELSGVIADLEKRIAQHRADLVHIDAVLRLYAPEVESEAIAPKAVRRRNGWFRPGKLPRLLLDVLRAAPAPLSVKALSVEPMKRRGLDPEDARTVHRVGKMVHDCLTRQSAGLVERVSDGKAAAWKVAQ